MSPSSDRVAVIIEDDADIRNLLEAILVQAGFRTHAVSTGLEGIEAVRHHEPILTTLDISLPGIDGFEVARRIRSFSLTYIIMLSARVEEIDTLMGLDAGADDYLTKPFRPRELRARIEAMLRRSQVGPPQALDQAAMEGAELDSAQSNAIAGDLVAVLGGSPHSQGSPAESGNDRNGGQDDWLHHGDIRLNFEMRVCELNGAPLNLTRTEFDLLYAVMVRHHRVISKRELALEIRGGAMSGDYVSEADQRAVEVHLANLRRKLNDQATDARYIETVRGVGYRLARPHR